MRRNIVFAIATVLLVATASAASAAQAPKQGKGYATQDRYQIADQQTRFKVGY
jgi:hypothetical protein